jgi:hypothetical protein
VSKVEEKFTGHGESVHGRWVHHKHSVSYVSEGVSER